MKTLNSLLQSRYSIVPSHSLPATVTSPRAFACCYIPPQISKRLCKGAGLVMLSLPARHALPQSLAFIWGWRDWRMERLTGLAELSGDQERLRWRRKSYSKLEPKRQREHATLLLSPWWKCCLSADPGGAKTTIILYQPLHLLSVLPIPVTSQYLW